MARDPPSLLASSELRDLPLEPSDVFPAKITIIHPQLRDLILPIERRRVLYPTGPGLTQLLVEGREYDDDDPKYPKAASVTTTPFAALGFTPNCLTGSRGMLAAGGQHGELHMSHIPSNGRRPDDRSYPGESVQPFRLDVKLGTSAINNAIVLLPDWPVGWAEVSERRRIGYVGRSGRSEYDALDDEMEGTREESGRVEPVDEGEDDEAMDLDEEEGDEVPPPLSPATYPNTVPFRHPPRIPTASTSTFAPARRAASFSVARTGPSQAEAARQARQSFSMTDDPQRIRIVSSNPGPSSRPETVTLSSSIASLRARSDPRTRPEPRLLVSSNDQSVRMLSLRQLNPLPLPDPVPAPRTTASYERESEAARLGRFEPTIRTHYRPSSSSAISATDFRSLHPVLPPPPPLMGSRFGWDSISVSQGLAEAHRNQARPMAVQRDAARREFSAIEAALGTGAGPSGSGLASPPVRPASASQPSIRFGTQAPWSQVRATAADGRAGKRSISTVGGKTLNFPVNHSSFSPDLKTMVSVGDSTDVQIFEVVDGGREFRQIATYTAATDSGFSSAWSKDGRKFAVASQDGQVTVWDHRSSRPLATLFTSVTGSGSSSALPTTFSHDPSFAEDISAARRSPSPTDGWSRGGGVMLFNPVTGEPSSGASTSGREAARVVKFSPEGSSRDLMVFSEENTNIHIVDAKTFNTHVVLPVPIDDNFNSPRAIRSGVEGGECGIAGVAFDPTGEWLYSGTERTIVEWDMRRIGGEGGGWTMA